MDKKQLKDVALKAYVDAMHNMTLAQVETSVKEMARSLEATKQLAAYQEAALGGYQRAFEKRA